jgi:hypothetical protein
MGPKANCHRTDPRPILVVPEARRRPREPFDDDIFIEAIRTVISLTKRWCGRGVIELL